MWCVRAQRAARGPHRPRRAARPSSCAADVRDADQAGGGDRRRGGALRSPRRARQQRRGVPGGRCGRRLAALVRPGGGPQPAGALLLRPGRQRRHAGPGPGREHHQHRERLGPATLARDRRLRRRQGGPDQPDVDARRRVGAQGAGQLRRGRPGRHGIGRRPLRGPGRDRARWRPPSRWAGWARPTDIAGLCLFLASPLASYVSGAASRPTAEGSGPPSCGGGRGWRRRSSSRLEPGAVRPSS